MPRPDLSMTALEVEALLERCATAVVAVPGPDGFPTATVALLQDHVLELPPEDPVTDAVDAGTPLCVVLDTWPDYAGIRGVILRGSSAPGGHLTVDRLASFDFSRTPS